MHLHVFHGWWVSRSEAGGASGLLAASEKAITGSSTSFDSGFILAPHALASLGTASRFLDIKVRAEILSRCYLVT
jgi:hypothetical protein